MALYNYKPRRPDELELVKGDYYSVSEKCMDGWFKGVELRSSTAGVFPGNYVMPVKYVHVECEVANRRKILRKRS